MILSNKPANWRFGNNKNILLKFCRWPILTIYGILFASVIFFVCLILEYIGNVHFNWFLLDTKSLNCLPIWTLKSPTFLLTRSYTFLILSWPSKTVIQDVTNCLFKIRCFKLMFWTALLWEREQKMLVRDCVFYLSQCYANALASLSQKKMIQV